MTGEHATDGEVTMGPGDLISIPTGIFRGFENIGTETGFLWAVLGGDDPGHVLWAPYVFEMAKNYGLVLLEDGTLIDAAKGQTIPPNARIMPATTREQVESMRLVGSSELEQCVLRHGSARPSAVFSGISGVTDRGLVGAEPITWPHGFSVSEVTLAASAYVPDHIFDVPDVWFVQQGSIEITIADETLNCGPGDTITVPRGCRRAMRNTGLTAAIVVQVRGGDTLPRMVRN